MELTFGEQIKIILKRKNMTIRQLAELVEVQTGKPMSRQNLTQKLNRDNFQEQDMKEIAQAIGCVVQISVVDPMEAAAVSPNPVVSQVTESVQQQRQKDHISGKSSVGRLRTGRHTAHLQEPEQLKPEQAAEAENTEQAAGLAKEEAAATRQDLPGTIAGEGGREMDVLAWARQKPLVWPTLTVPTVEEKESTEPLQPGEGGLPFEEDLFSDLEDLEEVPLQPGEEEAADDLEDLEFFDLEDFYGDEISQVSAPYVMKREEPRETVESGEMKNSQEAKRLRDKEKLFRKEKTLKKERRPGKEEQSGEAVPKEQAADKETGGFDRIPGGDVSFASAPYVIPRESETEKAGQAAEELTIKESKKKEFGRDISSVSAPYVIPREPEELPPQKPMGENGYWQEIEETESNDWMASSEEKHDEIPEEEEESLGPDMEEKIASWDAAVKRQLQNPFLRSLEGRARQAADSMDLETTRNQAAGQADEMKQAVHETGAEGGRMKRAEEETIDLQGPAIDPDTGLEYETNTVKHHPTQSDMLLVYDKDEHRWIVQAERAFLNFQLNKRALLGKDYEPPVYLD